MAEEKDERDDASTGVALKKFMNDAMATMDSMSKRMDSMEESMKAKKDAKADAEGGPNAEEKERADAEEKARKDAEDKAREDSTVIYRGNKAPTTKKDEAEDEPEAKARKDEEEKKEREDAARKDAEEKERMDASRKDSAADDRMKRLEEALGDVVKVLPKARSDEDYHAMCDVQARADEVYSALGQRSAPRFLDGEDSLGYRRRLVRDLKKHSPDWKDVNIHAITDDSAFSVMERRVYADAMSVAATPVTADPGTLRAVHRTGPGGHKITEYVGEPSTWMNTFAGPVRQYAEGRIAVRNDN